MTRAELREYRRITQVQLAKKLRVQQSGVSKFELNSNPSLKSLRRYIKALGGELQVHAVYDVGSFRLDI